MLLILYKLADVPFVWYVLVLNLGTIIVFWVISGFYLLVDWTKRPLWMYKYKIKNEQTKTLNWETYKEVIIDKKSLEVITY